MKSIFKILFASIILPIKNFQVQKYNLFLKYVQRYKKKQLRNIVRSRFLLLLIGKTILLQ